MKLINYNQLRERGVPYTREHLRRLIADQQFPAPVPLSKKRIAWIEDEVSAWIAEAIARRPQHDKRAA